MKKTAAVLQVSDLEDQDFLNDYRNLNIFLKAFRKHLGKPLSSDKHPKIGLNVPPKIAEVKHDMPYKEFKRKKQEQSLKAVQLLSAAASQQLKSKHPGPPFRLVSPDLKKSQSDRNQLLTKSASNGESAHSHLESRLKSPQPWADSVLDSFRAAFPHNHVLENTSVDTNQKSQFLRKKADHIYDSFYSTASYDCMLRKKVQDFKKSLKHSAFPDIGLDVKETAMKIEQRQQLISQSPKTDFFIRLNAASKAKKMFLLALKSKNKRDDEEEYSWELFKHVSDGIAMRPLKIVAENRHPHLDLVEEDKPFVSGGRPKAKLQLMFASPTQPTLPRVEECTKKRVHFTVDPSKTTTLPNEATNPDLLHLANNLSEVSVPEEGSDLKFQEARGATVTQFHSYEENLHEKNQDAIRHHKQKLRKFQDLLDKKLKKFGAENEKDLLKMVKYTYYSMPRKPREVEGDREVLKDRKPKKDLFAKIEEAKPSEQLKHLRYKPFVPVSQVPVNRKAPHAEVSKRQDTEPGADLGAGGGSKYHLTNSAAAKTTKQYKIQSTRLPAGSAAQKQLSSIFSHKSKSVVSSRKC